MPSLRPSQIELQSREDDGPFVDFRYFDEDGAPLDEAGDALLCEVYFNDVSEDKEKPENLDKWHQILSVSHDDIKIFPIRQRSQDPCYGMPKYEPIESVTITRSIAKPYPIPSDIDELEEVLSTLPIGFARQWRIGLGLLYEYRFIMESIAEAGDVSAVVIHGEDGSDDAKIVGDTFYLGIDRYRDLKQTLDRLSNRYQREARSDKRLVCYTGLAHVADPLKNPAQAKRIPPNVLTDLIKLGRGRPNLSTADQASVVDLVKSNAVAIAKKAPEILLSLKAEIELVTLGELIVKYKELLAGSAKEDRWQRFFSSNPFILDMAFAYPVKMICDRPYVGGKRFSSRGGNYSDFLMIAKSTGNVAIVEIKHHSKDVISGKPYRNDTYAPSSELIGSVAQAINQRANLQREIHQLAEDLEERVYAHAIPAIVVIGTVPKDKHQKRSFEQYRNCLKDVVVVTFDELLERLIDIQKALSPPKTVEDPLKLEGGDVGDDVPPWSLF